MSQFGHYSTTVRDTAGNVVSGASVTIYREGATLASSQSGTSPKTFTVADHGGISTGDTVFINTTTGTTYAVDAATTTTITLSGFAGTLSLNSGDRIVPSNSKPTIYQDDAGATAASNPLTTNALGFAECYIALAANDTPQDFYVLASGSGITSELRSEQAWPSPPTLGNIRWAHQYDSTTSETDGIQEAIDSIGDSSSTNPYTVMLRPGTYTVNHADTSVVGINMWGTGLDGTGASRNFISLAGMDQYTCIIKRTTAASALTAVIQATHNCSLFNLTIDCEVTRHVHWDPTVTPAAGASLECSNVRFLSTTSGASQSGISAGATGGSAAPTIVRVANCYFRNGAVAVHGASASNIYGVVIWVTGCQFDLTGAIAGFSIPAIAEPWLLMFSGNVQNYFNVDPGSGAINLNMPTTLGDGKYVRLMTDGSLRVIDSVTNPNVVTDNAENMFYNAIIYPMEHNGRQCTAAVTSGDVVVHLPATNNLNTTTTADAQWPAVCCNQLDTTSTANWFPRLCTGPMGVCFVESAQAVAPGDTLVTSVTAKDAMVNNAQTDLTRVIGWAIHGKTAGARRLVSFRRNMTLAW